MTKPVHPVFLSLRKKLMNLDREMLNLIDYASLAAAIPREFASEWGASVATGGGIRNVLAYPPFTH